MWRHLSRLSDGLISFQFQLISSCDSMVPAVLYFSFNNNCFLELILEPDRIDTCLQLLLI